MAKWMVVFLTLTGISLHAQRAASQDGLLGTWKLVSARITTDKGEVRDSWGPEPMGFLTYTPDGRMSAILTFRNRKALSVSDVISAPAEERAEAFATMMAYAGRDTHTGNTVVHHVEATAMPNDVGNDLERTIVKLDADHPVLRVTSAYRAAESWFGPRNWCGNG